MFFTPFMSSLRNFMRSLLLKNDRRMADSWTRHDRHLDEKEKPNAVNGGWTNKLSSWKVYDVLGRPFRLVNNCTSWNKFRCLKSPWWLKIERRKKIDKEKESENSDQTGVLLVRHVFGICTVLRSSDVSSVDVPKKSYNRQLRLNWNSWLSSSR